MKNIEKKHREKYSRDQVFSEVEEIQFIIDTISIEVPECDMSKIKPAIDYVCNSITLPVLTGTFLNCIQSVCRYNSTGCHNCELV